MTEIIFSRDFYRPVMPRMPIAAFDPTDPVEVVDACSLRYARPADMPDISEIASKLWDTHMAATFVHQTYETLGRPNAGATFVLQSGRKVAAFAGIRPSWVMPKTAELIGINVDPDHQGRGFGRILTEARLELAKELGVRYVILSTIRPGFFRRFGFVPVDTHGEWVIMKKEI